MTPSVIDNPPRRDGAITQSLRWDADPRAELTFALRPTTAYIVSINDGAHVTGRQILEAFRPMAAGRRIKVVEASFDRIEFWEEMVRDKLVDDWGMESATSLL